jgi:hypothetical protein
MKKILFLLTTLMALFGMTQKPQVVTIKGEVGVYGSVPHTFLAIKDKNNTLYKVTNAKDFNLSKLQNQIVEIKALFISKDPIFKDVKDVEILELNPFKKD